MKIFLFHLPWIIELIHDAIYIRFLNKSPNKKTGVAIRSIVSLAVAIIYLSDGSMIDKIGLFSSLGFVFFLDIWFHFVFFNYTLNKVTGKPFFHLGNGPVDKIEKGFQVKHMLILRVLILGTAIAMFYKIPPYYGL